MLNSNTTVSVVNPGDSVTISGNITGNGGLTIDNPGDSVVVLSGTNSYGGGTTVQTGNLQLGSAVHTTGKQGIIHRRPLIFPRALWI